MMAACHALFWYYTSTFVGVVVVSVGLRTSCTDTITNEYSHFHGVIVVAVEVVSTFCKRLLLTMSGSFE